MQRYLTAEVTPLIPHLLLSSDPSHGDLASDLSSRVSRLRTSLQTHLGSVWAAVPRVEEARRAAVVGDAGAEGGAMGDALRAWRAKEGMGGPAPATTQGKGQAQGDLELHLEPLKIVAQPELQAWVASPLL